MAIRLPLRVRRGLPGGRTCRGRVCGVVCAPDVNNFCAAPSLVDFKHSLLSPLSCLRPLVCLLFPPLPPPLNPDARQFLPRITMGCVQSTGVDDEAKARAYLSPFLASSSRPLPCRQRCDREPAQARPRHGEERDQDVAARCWRVGQGTLRPAHTISARTPDTGTSPLSSNR